VAGWGDVPQSVMWGDGDRGRCARVASENYSILTDYLHCRAGGGFCQGWMKGGQQGQMRLVAASSCVLRSLGEEDVARGAAASLSLLQAGRDTRAGVRGVTKRASMGTGCTGSSSQAEGSAIDQHPRLKPAAADSRLGLGLQARRGALHRYVGYHARARWREARSRPIPKLLDRAIAPSPSPDHPYLALLKRGASNAVTLRAYVSHRPICRSRLESATSDTARDGGNTDVR